MQTHKIKKFVLHTNFPGHSDFNTYMKCNFVIYDSDGEYCYTLIFEVDLLTSELFNICFLFVDKGTIQPGNTSKNCITPNTKWEQVKVKLCNYASL